MNASKKILRQTNIIANYRIKRCTSLIDGLHVNKYTDKMVGDFILGNETNVLFLSLKYYSNNPSWLDNEIEVFISNDTNYKKVVLILKDTEDNEDKLMELNMKLLNYKCIIIFSNSYKEASQYVHQFSFIKNKGKYEIDNKLNSKFQVLGALSMIRSLSQQDAYNLLLKFVVCQII